MVVLMVKVGRFIKHSATSNRDVINQNWPSDVGRLTRMKSHSGKKKENTLLRIIRIINKMIPMMMIMLMTKTMPTTMITTTMTMPTEVMMIVKVVIMLVVVIPVMTIMVMMATTTGLGLNTPQTSRTKHDENDHRISRM